MELNDRQSKLVVEGMRLKLDQFFLTLEEC